MQAASADATMLWFAALDGACADHARAKLCELAGRLQHYCVNHCIDTVFFVQTRPPTRVDAGRGAPVKQQIHWHVELAHPTTHPDSSVSEAKILHFLCKIHILV